MPDLRFAERENYAELPNFGNNNGGFYGDFDEQYLSDV